MDRVPPAQTEPPFDLDALTTVIGNDRGLYHASDSVSLNSLDDTGGRMRLLLLLGVTFTTITVLAGDEKKDPSERQRKAILEATNEFRKANKLPPLTLNEKLTKAAQGHLTNLEKQGKLGDDGKNPHNLDGKNAADRVKDVGYAGKAVRENIVLVRASPKPYERAMTSWKNSPTHRRNMLATDVDEIGIGAIQTKAGGWYFCQVFSSPAERPASLQFEIENKTKDSVEMQFSLEKEGRTLKSSEIRRFACRLGTPETGSLTVFYRKPSKEKVSLPVKDGYRYVISDKEGNGRYTIDQAENQSKDASR
jgi:uncharacterized protein YkwD